MWVAQVVQSIDRGEQTDFENFVISWFHLISIDFNWFEMISISEISFYLFIEDKDISSEKVRNDEKSQEILEIIEKQKIQ